MTEAQDTGASVPDTTDMLRSTRDLDALGVRLRSWLAQRLPDGSDPEVVISNGAVTTGLSSETILIDAAWDEGSGRRSEALVARVAPDESDVPVFASYDLHRQFETLRLVDELTDVPVPKMWWLERDPRAIGSQFFVMSRIEGEVPPDLMPYTFGDNWLFDASTDQKRRLQEASVSVLAKLHAIERPEQVFAHLSFDEPGDSALKKHVAHTRAWYDFAVAGGARSRLVEQCFEWLYDNWPDDDKDTVLSWGDARIGNMMYRDFQPVAVLDWEMAGLGPRELDVAWMIFAHRVFQDIAGALELPGMPDFMSADDVIRVYEKESGTTLGDLSFYATYAAVQWGIVFLRTGQRQAHFGQITLPDDPDDLMHHRGALEKMADGRYWN
jgi:aminoglycoside phosphotransferase (APT) family kinase protein